MPWLSIPTTSRLPDSMRLESSHPVVVKLLGRLSRPALLSLSISWLAEEDLSLTAPYLRRPRRSRTGHGRDELLGDEEEEEEEAEGEDGFGSDAEDSGDLYPASRSLEELREVYSTLQAGKGSRREVVDRILEGDWRDGLTLYQLATADLQYLHDHSLSQKWSAYRITALRLRRPADEGANDGDEDVEEEPDRTSLLVPRFHPSSFLRTLQAQLPPDVKAHCTFERHRELPVLLLRIFIFESPYNTAAAGAAVTAQPRGNGSSSAGGVDASRTVYVAFPDASPHVYISGAVQLLPGGTGGVARGEAMSLRGLVVEGIPKALSRPPKERYALRPTSLSTRNMGEMLHRRGQGRTNAAGGGWSIYSDQRKKESPLDTMLPTPPLSSKGSDEDEDEEKKDSALSLDGRKRKPVRTAEEERGEREEKRRRLVALARFGDSARVDDGLGVERLDVVIQDPFPAPEPQRQAGDTGNPETEDIPTGPGGVPGSRRTTLDAAFQREAALRGDEDDEPGGGGEGEVSVWRPGVKLTFHGPHVFAGIRQLVEAGLIDGGRMPGWMTGEEGVTIGAVRDGRIRGHKGSGL